LPKLSLSFLLVTKESSRTWLISLGSFHFLLVSIRGSYN
jgi:hypothetical protein